jgi:hypothetical protein
MLRFMCKQGQAHFAAAFPSNSCVATAGAKHLNDMSTTKARCGQTPMSPTTQGVRRCPSMTRSVWADLLSTILTVWSPLQQHKFHPILYQRVHLQKLFDSAV